MNQVYLCIDDDVLYILLQGTRVKGRVCGDREGEGLVQLHGVRGVGVGGVARGLERLLQVGLRGGVAADPLRDV